MAESIELLMDVEDLAIVGPPENVTVAFDIGSTGKRGSLWFTGEGLPSPLTIPNYDELAIGDMYMDASDGGIYQMILLPSNTTDWVKTDISAAGPTGPKGDKGDKGETGPANTLEIGTVTTGAPGSAAAVSITGTAPNQTLNLTLPKGEPGYPYVTTTGAAPNTLIDDRTPRGPAVFGTTNKTGAIVVPFVVSGGAMFTAEIEIHMYNSGYVRATVEASVYAKSDLVYSSNTRISVNTGNLAALGPLARPKVRWVTPSTGTIYLVIGDAADSWPVSNVSMPRVVVTYTSATLTSIGVPNWTTTIPTGASWVSGVVLDAGSDLTGTGMPNGVISAPVGTYYTDTQGTNGAWRWLKTSGTGNTGWECIIGDTWWRKTVGWTEGVLSYGVMPAGLAPQSGSNGGIYYRRINLGVYFQIVGAVTPSVANLEIPIPAGFSPGGVPYPIIGIYTDAMKVIGTKVGSSNIYMGPTQGNDTFGSGSSYASSAQWITTQPWPTTLPGTAA